MRTRNITEEDVLNVFRNFDQLTLHFSGGLTYSDGFIGVALSFDTKTLITAFYVFDPRWDYRYKDFNQKHNDVLRCELLKYRDVTLTKEIFTGIVDRVLEEVED